MKTIVGRKSEEVFSKLLRRYNTTVKAASCQILNGASHKTVYILCFGETPSQKNWVKDSNTWYLIPNGYKVAFLHARKVWVGKTRLKEVGGKTCFQYHVNDVDDHGNEGDHSTHAWFDSPSAALRVAVLKLFPDKLFLHTRPNGRLFFGIFKQIVQSKLIREFKIPCPNCTAAEEQHAVDGFYESPEVVTDYLAAFYSNGELETDLFDLGSQFQQVLVDEVCSTSK